VSVLPLTVDPVDSQDSGREQLLALFAMRRGLESRSSNGGGRTAMARPMIAHAASQQADRAQIVRELHELIEALDRRLPQVERVGEVAIARAAADLRSAALKRIEELER
jgi:hypothetical protein